MLKKLYDEEKKKLEVSCYMGGGYDPLYGPRVEKANVTDFNTMSF